MTMRTTARIHTRMTLKHAGAALGLLLLVLGGCDDGITVPDDAPAQEGVVFRLNSNPFTQEGPLWVPNDWTIPDSLESVWVKPTEEDPCGVVWTLRPGTDLLVQEGSALRRAVPEDFRSLREVRVWTDGAILLSCPGQGSPTTVLLR